MKTVKIICLFIFTIFYLNLYTFQELSFAKGPFVLFENFDGPHQSTLLKQLTRNKHVSLVSSEGVNGSKAIKVLYEGFDQGSKRVVVDYTLPKSDLEYTLNYDVKFCEDFDFVLGGKLHGLGPGKPAGGGQTFSGDQWSARVLFKAGGKIQTYTYHQDQKGKYGEGERVTNFSFDKNKYYAISLHVRVNDPISSKNGYSKVYVNGELVAKQENIRFRSIDGKNSLINKFLFHTFHGGNTSAYAPREPNGKYKTVCAYFDNIAVYPWERIRLQPGQ